MLALLRILHSRQPSIFPDPDRCDAEDDDANERQKLTSSLTPGVHHLVSASVSSTPCLAAISTWDEAAVPSTNLSIFSPLAFKKGRGDNKKGMFSRSSKVAKPNVEIQVPVSITGYDNEGYYEQCEMKKRANENIENIGYIANEIPIKEKHMKVTYDFNLGKITYFLAPKSLMIKFNYLLDNIDCLFLNLVGFRRNSLEFLYLCAFIVHEPKDCNLMRNIFHNIHTHVLFRQCEPTCACSVYYCY